MKLRLLSILTAITFLCAFPARTLGFSTDTYTASSVLSSGRWVKISVETTGPHLIPTSTLRTLGFTNPENVRVYGYGGRRIPDLLSIGNYIDDLPPVRSELTSAGIVFYAEGPVTWTRERNDIFTHSLNPYSTLGYYFLSDSRPQDDPSIPTEGSAPQAGAATTFTEHLYHELEQSTPAESGHQLLGEDFRFTPSRTFGFQLPGRVEDTDIWMQCEFYGKSVSTPINLTFTANGQTLPKAAGDKVSGGSNDNWGDTCRIRKRFTINGSSLSLGIGISVSGALRIANLDKIDLTYTRRLALPASGHLVFSSDSRSLRLEDTSAETRIWDVTDPRRPIAMRATADGKTSGWTNDYNGLRTYCAWTSTSSLPQPRLVRQIDNQDIHAAETPDMIIISPLRLLDQSNRIAAIHTAAPDNMKVLVVTDEQVFNEFGSGCADVNAMRRMLKMFYDRGKASPSATTLKYVLLMGGATHDHRRLTSAMSSSAALTLPIWQSEHCINESNSFCSDDILTFLEDNSGLSLVNATSSIAVGRIPARSTEAAETYVRRLEKYVTSPAQSEWRNRIMMFADDGNGGDHMTQTKTMEARMLSTESGSGFTFNKVFIDAYRLTDGTSKEAADRIFSLLDDGVILWSYIGHGSINSLSGDGIFTTANLNSLYLRQPPFFYAATCTFAQFDGSATCGMESLLLTDNGGIIGGLSAVRPVYIARNGVLSDNFGKVALTRDSDGRFIPMGEVVRQAKNMTADENIRRYVFFGDPALRLATPVNTVRLLSVDGTEVSDESRPELKALGRPVVRGEICDPSGNRIDSFNGWLSLTLFDAEHSLTSEGRGDDGESVTFDEKGERLFSGRTSVTDGLFEITIPMPSEVAENYRPATMTLFAAADDGTEAAGVSRNLYVYGFDYDAETDDVPPVIESLYLDHESFRPSDVVGANPVLIARVRDDVALNMSNLGIGHQMSLRIDNDLNLTDVSNGYTPDIDGSPAGSIFYRLPDLSAGNHTATLRIWDTAGNSASASIDFFVNPDLAPKIFDIYSDANPAVTQANFYVTHNRPEATLTVRIEIYDLNGKLLWDSETTGRADMYSSSPVTWNLTDRAGSKVTRGIYLYKTTVTTGGRSSTMTKRIAVAPL